MDRLSKLSRWGAVVVFPVVGCHIAVRLWSPDFWECAEAILVMVLMIAFALEEIVVIVAPDTAIWRVR